MSEAVYPSVSVIIPVYNDAERLAKCLQALANQTYPSDRITAIVVDNDSDDPQATAAVVQQFPQAQLLHEPQPGSYAARNRGIAAAHSDLVAFTDADCIPTPTWLENSVRHLLDTPNCGLVVGRVDLFFKDPQRPTPVELYESLTAFPQAEHLAKRRGGATANVLTSRAVLDDVGGFNSQFKSYGDLEWGSRIYEAGYAQVYADDAVVTHPARYSFAQLRQRTLRLAGGVYERFVSPQDPWLRRNLTFARLLWDDCIPPVNFAIRAFRETQLKGLRQRLQVCGTICIVRFFSAREKLRLRFGGVSTR